MKAAIRPIQPDGRLHGVIAGCRDDHGRFLLIRRSMHVAAPGRICFPGGAVEAGESRRHAVQREIREELGVGLELGAEIWKLVFPDQPLTLFGWIGQLHSSDLRPDPAEVAEVLWLTAEQIASEPDVLPYSDSFCDAMLTFEAGGGRTAASPR
jgi:8-oxo-dGTP pyrophosphatase MutT (NUDIX family)